MKHSIYFIITLIGCLGLFACEQIDKAYEPNSSERVQVIKKVFDKEKNQHFVVIRYLNGEIKRLGCSKEFFDKVETRWYFGGGAEGIIFTKKVPKMGKDADVPAID
jgi:hypothetical protein